MAFSRRQEDGKEAEGAYTLGSGPTAIQRWRYGEEETYLVREALERGYDWEEGGCAQGRHAIGDGEK